MRKLIDYILSLSKRWGLDQMMKILGYKKVSNEESWTNHIFMKTHTHTAFFHFLNVIGIVTLLFLLLRIFFLYSWLSATNKNEVSTEEERCWTCAKKRLRLVNNQWDKSRACTIGKRFLHLISSFIYSS